MEWRVACTLRFILTASILSSTLATPVATAHQAAFDEIARVNKQYGKNLTLFSYHGKCLCSFAKSRLIIANLELRLRPQLRFRRYSWWVYGLRKRLICFSIEYIIMMILIFIFHGSEANVYLMNC